MSGCDYPHSRRSGSSRVICATWPESQWRLSDVTAPLAALPTAPRIARAHVRTALLAWGMSSLADVAELVASELVTNALRASEQPGRPLSRQDRRTPVIGICLLADEARLRIEVWDQAAGLPVLREVPADFESGRGLTLVDALTEGRWGWHPAALPWTAKCVWAEIGHPARVPASPNLTSAFRHPTPETGARNMTTAETELVPSAAATLSASTADPPFAELPITREGGHTAFSPDNEAFPRELISPGLFSKLAHRVMADAGHDQDTAERIVEQALSFLVACARYPDGHLSPSETVDAGWHAFILHTADYAEFCQRVAGRFIHHRPSGPGEAVSEQQAIGVTIAAMRDASLLIDPALWVPRAACSQCYQGCADDPKGV
jgi:anti-sigma regulatory factor (Ser/Thr protein kinase)